MVLREPSLLDLDEPQKGHFGGRPLGAMHHIRQPSESLAGRIAYLELTPFRLNEVASHVGWQQLWIRGGFPDSLLASDEQASCDWRSDFIQTFLERDIPGLGFGIPVPTMERLWRLLAHYHGQTVNFSKLAGAMDVSIPTPKKLPGYSGADVHGAAASAV